MDSIPHHKSDASHPEKKQQHGHQPPSSSELLSSAKLVAEAAQASLHRESNKVDKARVAGAAADLLNAASHYGKLEGKSFGKYIEKAEDYLDQYHSSHSSHSSTTTAAASTTSHPSSHSGGDHENSGGGYGDYFKMAEGFLKKH